MQYCILRLSGGKIQNGKLYVKLICNLMSFINTQRKKTNEQKKKKK